MEKHISKMKYDTKPQKRPIAVQTNKIQLNSEEAQILL